MLKILNCFWILTTILSCTSTGNNKGLLQNASGTPGEIILAMDSTKWRGKLGDAVRDVFTPSVKGLPRDEPLFTVRYVDPLRLNIVLKTARNMIFVTSLESSSNATQELKKYFTPESLKQIRNDKSLFMHINEDEFAKGQSVLYLFGQTDEILADNLINHKAELQDYFNQIEENRLMASLYKARETTGINERLLEEHSCLLRVPVGYQIVEWEEEFIWLRSMGLEIDKNLVITYMPYYSKNQLSADGIIKWRNQKFKKYIFEDPEIRNSYMVTESLITPISSETTLLGKYARKIKGLWKTNNLAMGGPFIGYSFVDETLNRIYYVEGFLYSPGKSQRELVRELETIIKTFRTKAELQQNNS